MEIIYFIVCFTTSVIGAICGIGGGVIIKPVLDAFGTLEVTEINFLSGCTVLSMSTYSIVKSRFSNQSKVEKKTGISLALGAAGGGVAGKFIFACIKEVAGQDSIWLSAGIGLTLGMMSSFLGIGGGPINLIVLFYFFPWELKKQQRIPSTLFFSHKRLT